MQSTFVIAPSRKFVHSARQHDPAEMLRTVLRTVERPAAANSSRDHAPEAKPVEAVEDAAGATVVPCSPVPCSGVARRASALLASEPAAQQASQRNCAFTPEIVATMESGTQVLLEESDMEGGRQGTPDPPSDDIEPDTPVKLRQPARPALAVKASFIDDIDAPLPDREEEPSARPIELMRQSELLSQLVPIPPAPPREMIRYQDLIKTLSARPAARPPPPEDGLTASQLMSNLASPPPQACSLGLHSLC